MDNTIKHQFTGKIEVPHENITLEFDNKGDSLNEFHKFVGKLISVGHSFEHHNSVECEKEIPNVADKLFKAVELLRNYQEDADESCQIDNSGFCQAHMCYVDDVSGLCLTTEVNNFISDFDEIINQEK